MRKLKLYIATSLDGFIARQDGKLDWLFAVPNPYGIDHGYNELLRTTDSLIMGYSTYNELLGLADQWPYPDRTTYVFTRKTGLRDTEFIRYVGADIITFTRDLKAAEGSDIWLTGGGQVFSSLMKAGLVDELMICIAPVILGKGIRLFLPDTGERSLISKEVVRYETGIVQLNYKLL